jgi:hypothetical protein
MREHVTGQIEMTAMAKSDFDGSISGPCRITAHRLSALMLDGESR